MVYGDSCSNPSNTTLFPPTSFGSCLASNNIPPMYGGARLFSSSKLGNFHGDHVKPLCAQTGKTSALGPNDRLSPWTRYADIIPSNDDGNNNNNNNNGCSGNNCGSPNSQPSNNGCSGNNCGSPNSQPTNNGQSQEMVVPYSSSPSTHCTGPQCETTFGMSHCTGDGCACVSASGAGCSCTNANSVCAPANPVSTCSGAGCGCRGPNCIVGGRAYSNVAGAVNCDSTSNGSRCSCFGAGCYCQTSDCQCIGSDCGCGCTSGTAGPNGCSGTNDNSCTRHTASCFGAGCKCDMSVNGTYCGIAGTGAQCDNNACITVGYNLGS